MSKTELRKQLRTLEADDLRELIMEIYGARREAKEYLEFWLNPDIRKKLDNAVKEINKELARVRRHNYACRISQIRKILKEFETYGPDDGMLLDLYISTADTLIARGVSGACSDAFAGGAVKFTLDFLAMIDKRGAFSVYFPKLTSLLDLYTAQGGRDWYGVLRRIREGIESYSPARLGKI